jgi:putative salt-induced outer membrane protein
LIKTRYDPATITKYRKIDMRNYMKNKSIKKDLLSCLIALSTLNVAIAEEVKPWDASAELGVVSASGNTEATSMQAKLDVKQNLDKWTNSYVLTGLINKSEVENDDGTTTNEKTAEKYFGSIKSAYDFGRKEDYLFLFASHADDKFGAYRRYSTISIGYGSRLIERETMQLDAEIGPGYVRGEKVFEDPVLPDYLVTEDGTMLRVAGVFAWQITSNAEFKQSISIESAEDNRRTLSETSLSTKINEVMQMKAAFALASDSEVAPGKEKTDTTTSITLVYKF